MAEVDFGASDATRASNRARFELELEFVQSLANPFYLHSLAQQSFFNQPAFVNFLEYLQYWKQKDYARFIHYPHALHHLDLLQHATFRTEIATDQWREYLNQKQFDHWRTWREPEKSAFPPDEHEAAVVVADNTTTAPDEEPQGAPAAEPLSI